MRMGSTCRWPVNDLPVVSVTAAADAASDDDDDDADDETGYMVYIRGLNANATTSNTLPRHSKIPQLATTAPLSKSTATLPLSTSTSTTCQNRNRKSDPGSHLEMRLERRAERRVEPMRTVPPQDGAVLLGKDESGYDFMYATRVRISSRRIQRDRVSAEVFHDTFVPCCAPEYRMHWRGRIWGFIRSEIFLLALHLIVITVGLLKIFIHDAVSEEGLHLAHAVIETVLTCMQVIIRSFLGKDRFHEIKELRMRAEVVLVDGDTRSTAVKFWIFFQIFMSFVLCTLAISVFVLCYLYTHLGWIVLSNNTVMIVSTFISSVTYARLKLMTCRIKEDQHKIALHEAALLLTEMYCAQTPEQRKQVRHRVEQFSKALKESPPFHLPEYISTLDEYECDVVTARESGV